MSNKTISLRILRSLVVFINMKLNEDLIFYRCLLKYLGILSVSYNQSKNVVYTTRFDRILAKCLLNFLQFIMVIALIYSCIYPDKFKLTEYNKTGNVYLVLNFWSCCLVMIILSIYFYFQRIQHAQILQTILQLSRGSTINFSSMKFSKLLVIYITLVVVCALGQTNAFLQSDMEILPIICYITILPFNFLYVSLIIVFYICITTIIEETLSYYNSQLESLVDLAIENGSGNVYQRIHDILLGRNRLISVCHTELNKIYGTALVFITAYILFTSPSAPFFFISTIFENKFQSPAEMLGISITCFMWIFPWWTVLILLLTSNGISKEVKCFNN